VYAGQNDGTSGRVVKWLGPALRRTMLMEARSEHPSGTPVVFMVVIQHSADASAQSAWLDSSDAPSAVQWCNDGCVILTRTHFLARGRVRTASGLCLIEGSNTGNGCGGVAPLPDIDYDSTG